MQKNLIHPSNTSINKILISPNKSNATNTPVVPEPVQDLPNLINGNESYNICEYFLIFFSYLIFFLTIPLSLCCSIKVVQEYQRAVIFRLGRIKSGKAKGPGLFFILPCIDNVVIADLRTQTFDVPPQEILTKDSVTISVDAVVYIQIFDPTASVVRVENAQFSTRTLAATTLRNIFGTKTLQEILSDRDSIARLMQEILDEATHKWGVSVERVEVKDVSLPVQMQRVMASEAEATREAKAKIIAAEGEEKASKALREAAKILTEAPVAVQLRYLQTLTDISAEHSSTIIFPVPIDMSPQISGFKIPQNSIIKSNGNSPNQNQSKQTNVNHSNSFNSSKQNNQNQSNNLEQNSSPILNGINFEKSNKVKDLDIEKALNDIEKSYEFKMNKNNTPQANLAKQKTLTQTNINTGVKSANGNNNSKKFI